MWTIIDFLFQLWGGGASASVNGPARVTAAFASSPGATAAVAHVPRATAAFAYTPGAAAAVMS